MNHGQIRGIKHLGDLGALPATTDAEHHRKIEPAKWARRQPSTRPHVASCVVPTVEAVVVDRLDDPAVGHTHIRNDLAVAWNLPWVSDGIELSSFGL